MSLDFGIESELRSSRRLKLLGSMVLLSQIALLYFKLSVLTIAIINILSLLLVYGALIVRMQIMAIKGINQKVISDSLQAIQIKSTFFRHVQEVEQEKLNKPQNAIFNQESHMDVSFQIKDDYPYLKKHFDVLPFNQNNIFQNDQIIPLDISTIGTGIIAKEINTAITSHIKRNMSLPPKQSNSIHSFNAFSKSTIKGKAKSSGKMTPSKNMPLNQSEQPYVLGHRHNIAKTNIEQFSSGKILLQQFQTPKQSSKSNTVPNKQASVQFNASSFLNYSVTTPIVANTGIYGLPNEITDQKYIEGLVSVKNLNLLKNEFTKIKSKEESLNITVTKHKTNKVGHETSCDANDDFNVRNFFTRKSN